MRNQNNYTLDQVILGNTLELALEVQDGIRLWSFASNGYHVDLHHNLVDSLAWSRLKLEKWFLILAYDRILQYVVFVDTNLDSIGGEG